MLEIVVRLLLQTELLEGGQCGELGPDAVIGGAQQVDDQLQLVDLRLAGQERLVGQELPQDAAAAPHVQGRGLGPRVEEQLRGPIPEGHHLRRHGLEGQAVVASQSEVGNLDAALVCHQKIGYFEITMDYVCRMEISEASKDLLHDAFDLKCQKIE